jgi:MtrB/PioB family decaheme-associated outer membrane protein
VNRRPRLLPLGAIGAALALGAAAQEDPFAALLEDTRPLLVRHITDYRGVLELGTGYVSEDNFVYGQYNGRHQQGPVLLGTLRWNQFSDLDSYWRASVDDLGLDTREGSLTWGRQDVVRIELGLDSQLQVRNNTGRTPFRGGSNLQLPDGWVSGSGTGDWTALDESLRQFDRELRRDRYSARVTAALRGGWTLRTGALLEEKEGHTDQAGAFYVDASTGDAALLRAPVDQRTTELDLGLGFSGTRLHLDAELRWSDFDNRENLLQWQNPYRSFNYGSEVRHPEGIGGLQLAPDNEQVSGRLSGQYLFSGSTRLQFDGSYAIARQDQGFADYSVNPALQVDQPLPRDSLDGEVASSTLSLKLMTRPLRDYHLDLWYRLRDRDYDVSRDGYRYIRGDATDQPEQAFTVYNTALDLTSQVVGSELGWRGPLHSRVLLGYEYERVDRRNSATEQTEEDRYSLGLRIRPLDNLNLRVDLLAGDRAADTYQWDQRYFALLDSGLINRTPDNQRFINHPELSQYYLSNRERGEVKFDASYTPHPNWNLNLNLLWRRDNFDKTNLGLLDSEWGRAHISASYAATRDLSATVYTGFDRFSSSQRSRAFRGGPEKNAFEVYPPLPQASDRDRDWEIDAEDDNITVGAALRWSPRETLELELDYSYVDTTSTQSLRTYGAADLTPADLPDVDTRLHQLRANGTWHLREALSLRLDYQYSRYSSNDWAWRGIRADSLDNVLTFGERNPNEQIHYAGLSVIYRWR